MYPKRRGTEGRLTGAESIGIVPEGVFPAYCHARFPGEDIVDFMNLPREHQDELAKYCRWQPIPVPRMKKEVKPMIFFTSDLHLGHENCIRPLQRPFSSIEEMDEPSSKTGTTRSQGRIPSISSAT